MEETSRVVYKNELSLQLSTANRRSYSSIFTRKWYLPLLQTLINKCGSRVKSGKFGHQVNSDTHLQTV